MAILTQKQDNQSKHAIINPATGEVIDHISWSTAEEVDQAIETAGPLIAARGHHLELSLKSGRAIA